MEPIFTVDGVGYRVGVSSIQRNGSIKEGKNNGTSKSGKAIRDVVGTYFDYTITLSTDTLSAADYDALYEVLMAPVDEHTVTMPYGQSVLTFQAGIYAASDTLELMDKANQWGELSVDFIASEPKRRWL